MTELILDRALPNDALEALHFTLVTAIGADKFNGVIGRKGEISLSFSAKASPDEINTALQLARNFDITTKTPEQEARAAKEAARTEFKETADDAIAGLRDDVDKLGQGMSADDVIPTLVEHVAKLTELVKQLLEHS